MAAASPAPAGAAPAAAADSAYGGEMTLAAALLSLFMPFIALIVALVMRGGELRPSRRGFDNRHWTAIYACVDGGTRSKPWHGKVP